MMSKSTCLLAITMAMLCGASVQAAVLDNPINNAIEKAVSDAMQSKTRAGHSWCCLITDRIKKIQH